MRAESYALLGKFPQFAETENLKSAGIGQDSPRPRHEPVQAAQVSHLLDAWPEQQVIRVAKQDLNSKLLENVLRHAFDRRLCSNRHENWGFDRAMRGGQGSFPGGILSGFDLKRNRHGTAILKETAGRP